MEAFRSEDTLHFFVCLVGWFVISFFLLIESNSGSGPSAGSDSDSVSLFYRKKRTFTQRSMSIVTLSFTLSPHTHVSLFRPLTTRK